MAEKKQTESVSLRLDTNTWDKIKTSASKQKTSSNALVSKILDSHVEWEMNAIAAGWVAMPKPFLIELFKLIDKEKIEKTITALSVRMAKDMTLYMRGKHDLNSWLSMLRARSSRSDFNWTEYEDDGELEIIMQHDMGENWSLYFKTFYENVFHDLGVKTEFDYTDNTLVIKIQKGMTSSWHK
ncbi:MAG: hypothetical protein ACREBB_00250 [Nitrosotalea sp.]